MCVCVRACVRACVRVCVLACACVYAYRDGETDGGEMFDDEFVSVNIVCFDVGGFSAHTPMSYPTGGCKIGQPLLALKAGGGFEMSTCYTNKDCHQGFYCSTALQDTSSRCCRSNSGQFLSCMSCTKPKVSRSR